MQINEFVRKYFLIRNNKKKLRAYHQTEIRHQDGRYGSQEAFRIMRTTLVRILQVEQNQQEITLLKQVSRPRWFFIGFSRTTRDVSLSFATSEAERHTSHQISELTAHISLPNLCYPYAKLPMAGDRTRNLSIT